MAKSKFITEQVNEGIGGSEEVPREGREVSGVRFAPGSIMATPGVLDAFRTSGDDPLAYLIRHTAGDWGDLSEEDQRENELSLREGFRLLSSYTMRDGIRFWIITEADRTVTTLLLPEEY